MARRNYKDESRANWGRHTPDHEQLRNDEIQLGAILRIADATELMAKRHEDLIARSEWLNRENARLEANLATERRRVAALRGVIRRHERLS